METWKKVGFVFMTILSLIIILIWIPYLYSWPKEEDPYPWFSLGVRTIVNELWDPETQMFRESKKEWQSYWIDDQTKLLDLLIQYQETYDDRRYEGNISRIIEILQQYGYEGYFPRRYVKILPELVNSSRNNFTMQNGFLRVCGNLTNPYDEEHPLRLRYYEASGYVDFGYLGGQLLIWDPATKYHDWVTYDPVRLRAEQCNNPGFDNFSHENETLEEFNQTHFYPWDFSFPKYWYFAESVPYNHNIYTSRFTHDVGFGNGRVIGLRVNNESAYYDWRSEVFQIQPNINYSLNFYYYGTYSSGTPIRIYFRWYDSNENWIGEEFIELSSSVSGWTSYNHVFSKTPSNAYYGDIRILSSPDTVAEMYFDNFQLYEYGNSLNQANIPNADFEIPDGMPFSNATYHSRWRSARFYGSGDYLIQYLAWPITGNQLYNITFWSKATSPPTTIYAIIIYSDGSIDEISKTVDSSDWNLYAIQGSELTYPTKEIIAFGFRQGTPDSEIFIDDVAFSYKPSGASYSASANKVEDPNEPGTYLYVEGVQIFEDDNIQVNITFRFSKGKPYLQQIMCVKNKQSFVIDVFPTLALDGLSGIISGEGARKTSYTSVWIPGVGRKYPDPNSWITVFYDSEHNPDEAMKWTSNYDYFIFELKQIPEWSGCLGLVVKVPDKYALKILQNTRNSTETGKYLHYITASFFVQGIQPGETGCEEIKILCLNGYDFVHPEKINYYLMNLDQFDNVDFSLNFHLGQIAYALAEYYELTKLDPGNMAEDTVEYYMSIFNGHNNGTYLMTCGKMIEACLKLYRLLDQVKYLNYAKKLGDYLVNIQLADGRFPMQHNNITYLDCQAVSVSALNELSSYGDKYLQACQKGLEAIKYGTKPSGYHRIPVGGVGDQIPNNPRLYVFANSTHIDDDFWTYKASYVAKASLGKNETLTMLALSRVWSRVSWYSDSLFIWISEETPDNHVSGVDLDPETNSETQPWGLLIWKEIAEWQRSNYNYYFMFLEGHYAITYADLSEATINVTITGWKDVGTLSRFYCKGLEDWYMVPQSILVDGSAISNVSSISQVETASDNCYYYSESDHDLRIKAFPRNSNQVKIYVDCLAVIPEIFMPINTIMGISGFFMLFLAIIYSVEKVKKGDFEALIWGFMFALIGFALIVGWLWSI